MTYEFKLPDIGEGLTEGEVVKWHVKEGDTVKENQPLCNVLTDKAEVEIPSPKSGRILKLMASEGQKVKVHAGLVVFDLAGGSAAPAKAAPERTQPIPLASKPAAAAPLPPPALPAPASKPNNVAAAAAGGSISATPAVRKLAADLKVDLAKLHGTGPIGRITEDDVRKAAAAPSPKGTAQPPAQPAAKPISAPMAVPDRAVSDTPTPKPVPVAAKPSPAAGPEERVPFIGIRRRTAEKMSASVHTAAHVTHMDEADFTALVKLREEFKPEAAKKGVKLTYIPFIIRALVKALKEFPDFNASLDEAAGQIVRKHYYNVGIATSAEQGLLVPVIKGVDGKDVWTLAGEVNRLAEKVRANKVEVSEIQGGTFTITNIGPIGGLFATPIINHPEVAILGVMKLQQRPVVKEGGIQIRDMVNLVLSFDHRLVDGAEAARFMNTLIKHLENPRTLL